MPTAAPDLASRRARGDRPAPLVDAGKLRKQLDAICEACSDRGADLRQAIVPALRQALDDGRREAERRLVSDGLGTQCATSLARMLDDIITALHGLIVDRVYPTPNPSDAERLSVVAVGGYGRGTLAPGSDVDLLFLLPYKQTAWGESVVEYLLYTLWDLGLRLGHATRSIEECIRLSRSDSTILTALLEARHVCGNTALFETFADRFDSDILDSGAEEFIADKLAERDKRLQRTGGSRYVVEPDVKDGKGGLRDLHTLFWIARFCYRTRRPADLVKQGVFTRAEYNRFRKCEDFLWTVRCHLHFLTGRGEDRLSFDLQPELAHRLGYTARGGLKHVERFMKHYFLVAKDVGALTRIFCAALEAQQMKKPPMLSRVLERLKQAVPGVADLPAGFRLDGGRITVTDSGAFDADPVNLIRLFHLADVHTAPIHPDALKLVTRSLKLIDDRLRNDPEANRLFVEILTSRNDPETVLRNMNEAGVLGRFVPPFGRIVALMQFNMYHHYTVDEHLLRTVGMVSEIESGHLADAHPLSSEIFHTIRHRRALYVAALLHDIAKGGREHHSVAGERIARDLCPRLGLSSAETDTVAWLVRHHLDMSDCAQMRDLADYKTILDFARTVQSPERLKLLLILTVADIKAVGPGVWNGWKGQLLRTLYYETEPLVTGGHVQVSRADRVAEAQALFRDRMKDWTDEEVDAYLPRHYAPYWLTVDIADQVAHARLIRDAEAEGRKVAITFATHRFVEITELTVFAPDHPRLLAVLTGACAAAGANIADARIFTTADGRALDMLRIQREFDDDVDEHRRAARIADLIEKALAGTVKIPELVDRAMRRRGRIEAFDVEPEVLIDNESSNLFTVIEVNGLDRAGLLFGLTSALSALNLNIGSAHIATFGERVVDVFYVTDLTGQKITSAARRDRIRAALLEVLSVPPGKPEKRRQAAAG